MTIRHAGLEALFGSRLSELRWQQLVNLKESMEESDIVDFKVAFAAGPNAAVEFAKDICAFANAQGGALIFGVAEENGVAKSLEPIEFSETKEQQLRSWAHGKAFPSPEIEFVRVATPDDANRGCLIVIVAKSARAPHAVQPDRDSGLRYVLRAGRDTRSLSESEVAERYRNRFVSAEARVERVEAISKAARERLRAEPSDCWVTLTLVPESQGRFEVSKETHARILDASRGLDSQRGSPNVTKSCPHLRLGELIKQAALIINVS